MNDCFARMTDDWEIYLRFQVSVFRFQRHSARLGSAICAQDRRGGLDKDFQVKQQRSLVNVGDVKFHALLVSMEHRAMGIEKNM